MQKGMNLREIAEAGLMVALAYVLSAIKLWRMPQGGSISLEMAPIFLFALRRGLKAGIIAGTVLGLLNLTLGPFIVHPLQFLLDYPLPFAALGIAGLFKGRGTWLSVLGIILASIVRFGFHFLSGVVFFGTYAPEGSNVVVYSAVYNATYMIPETALSILIVIPLMWVVTYHRE